MNKNSIVIYYISFILLILLSSCITKTKDNTDIETNRESISQDTNSNYEIFGIITGTNEKEILNKLQEEGILKVKSLSVTENKEFKSAVVEFASVDFGVNPGLVFMTSRFDKEAIDSLVSKISSFYGEPEVTSDFDDEEPQYKYYKWNAFDPDKPYIFIRPIHSEEGGLTMMWN